MKRYLFMIAAAILLVPTAVNAASYTYEQIGDQVCSGDTCTETYEVYLSPGDSGDITIEKDSPLTGTFTKGSDIVSVIAEDGDEFTFDINGDNATLTPILSTVTISDKTLLFTLEVEYNNVPSPDCDLSLVLNGTSSTIITTTPSTGLDLPTVILGLSLVAGIGMFVITKNKTKMYKI